MNNSPPMKQFQEYVARKVASGAYASEDEAVESILQTLEAMELQQAELRKLLEAGVAQANRKQFSRRSVDQIVRDVKAEAGLL